ncbi:D-hexose-6-phosphate mutarotase [Salinivibrio sp. ES.052]|uniref:D-hexose-6-phosphate mutarotase n=1 Tax=Salinivibrio sp. ES.052 TaxID=1882823 RepID=UPI0009289847|nr:D-hexose-6-phosphate mutarotase [Salinivibrio sp. ES.052]SIN77343.1 glucose-6-phosphate 1-epimerase [Salinivibrio sp. ES.052]
MTLPSLHVERQLSASVDLCYRQSVPILRVAHPSCSATISLFGGHLITFAPSGEKSLTWMSDNAIYDAKTPLRGGVPICWPWFGNTGQPSHGFARRQMWQLAKIEETPEGATIQLELFDSEASRALWPHRFHATVTFTLTHQADIALTVTNTDKHPWTMGGALHSYLAVEDSEQVNVEGVGCQYLDNFAAGKQCPAPGKVTFQEPVDRIYTGAKETLTLTDPLGNRRLKVNNRGATSAVIWNPGQAAAVKMADMEDNGYLKFVCIEAAIEQPTQVVHPRQSYTLATQLLDERYQG